jgi:hypothetical protein
MVFKLKINHGDYKKMISLIKNTLIRRNFILRPSFTFAKSLG